MNEFYIVLDALFKPELVSESKTASDASDTLSKFLSGTRAEFIQTWNMVSKGQKSTRAGKPAGLRVFISCDGMTHESITELIAKMSTFSDSNIAEVTVSFAESPSIPLDRKRKLRLPFFGKVGVYIEYTNALGVTESSKIKTALGDQAVETKNGLNPIGEGKKSSSGRFSEEFRSIFSNPYFFLGSIIRLENEEGIQPIGEAIKGKSHNAMYMLNYNLEHHIESLSADSEGKWWDKLDPESLDMNPTLRVVTQDGFDSKYDPCSFHHHESSDKRIDNVYKMENMQTAGSDENEIVKDELEYIFSRLTREKRPQLAITGDEHGLVPGLESSLVGRHVVGPWFIEEMYNSLAYFVMTAKPRFWRNGSSRVFFFHNPEEVDIKEIIGE
jgi:hypothetical protein